MVDVDSAVGKGEGGGDVESVGKDGDLVTASIAIGVLENFDFVVADALGFDFVGIVDCFGGPEASFFIPCEADGIDDLGFGGEELELPADGGLGVFEAIGRSEGVLILERLGAFFVVGDVIAGLVGERRAGVEKGLVGFLTSIADGPEDAGLEELVEIGLGPDALIVAGGGVEDAALALRAGPGPGFGGGDVVVAFRFANHEDVAI